MTVEINLEKLSLQTKLALAKERELDKTIQEMLARDDSEQVKIALIHNASTSEEILTKFLEEDENLIEELKRNSRIVKKFENLFIICSMQLEEQRIQQRILQGRSSMFFRSEHEPVLLHQVRIRYKECCYVP